MTADLTTGEIVPWTPPTPAEIQLLDRRTDSWTAVLVQVAQLAREICDTDMIPEPYRGNPAAVTAIVLAGREVGLPPMRALGQSFMVNGKVGILAEAQRGLILAAGHSLEFQESTGTVCKMRGRRRGTEYWHTVVWTKDMARAAGIIDGRNRRTWERYPRQMLKARCTAELARDLFADVIGGYQAAEEMDADLATVYTATDTPDTPTGDQTVVRRATPVRGRTPTPNTPLEGATGHQEPPQTPNRPTDTPPAGTGVEPPLPGDPDWADDDTQTTPGPAAGGGPTRAGRGPGMADRGGDRRPTAHHDAGSPAADEREGGPARGEGNPDRTDGPPTQRDTSEWAATRPRIARIVIMFDEYGITDRQDRLDMTSRIVGRTLESANDLTRKEAGQVIDVLSECARQDNPLQALDDLLLTLIQVGGDEPEQPELP